MTEKEAIPLEYADEAVRLEERGPIPDGYLGHRADPEELVEIREGTYESVRLGLVGWTIVILVAFALLYLVAYLVLSPLAGPA